MKKLIATHKNGFTYRPLPKMDKVAVRDDIREFVSKENLKRLNEGEGTFLNRALILK